MTRRIAAILFCTLISTWQYITVTLATCADCNSRMADIMHGESAAPFAYRLLTPLLVTAPGNTPYALALFHLGMFAMFFSLLWLWASRWHLDPLAIVALAALAAIVMLPTYYYSAWTILEWNFLLCGLLLLPGWSSSAR